MDQTMNLCRYLFKIYNNSPE